MLFPWFSGSLPRRSVQNRGGIDTLLHMDAPLERLIGVAVDQHGLFTVEQARTAGVGADQVRRMAANGVLERRSQGVYRIASVPFGQYAEFMEAVLWAKGRAVVCGESALLLWDLADVNPRKIHLAVPSSYRPRRRRGELYVIHALSLRDDEVDEVRGVPVVSPSVAVSEAIDWGVPGDLVAQAIHRGVAREHIGASTADRLSEALKRRTTGVKGKAAVA